MDRLLYYYARFEPKIGLLTIVATMMAGLLAISLPLVVSGISRILDRYQSEVISQILQRKLEYKLSIFLGVVVVFLLCIISTFIEESTKIVGIWKILYCLNIIFFISFFFAFIWLFFTAIIYSNDSKHILKEFADSNYEILRILEMEKILSEKKLGKLQKKLLDNLEGIGDILSFLSPRIKYNLYIIKQLDKLSSITDKFINLIKKHPERFALLSFSQEYKETFSNQDTNSQLRKWALEHSPEKNFIVFSVLINQIARTHQQAFIHSNLEIARETIRFTIISLKYLSVQSDQEAIIQYYLTQLYYRKFNCDGQEKLEYYKTITVYLKVVFESDFKIDKYLTLFDYFLFEKIKYIVVNNMVKSIIRLCRSATQDINIIPPPPPMTFSKYNQFKNTNRELVKSLIIKLINIRLVSEINVCCKEFNELAVSYSNKQEILKYQQDFYSSAIKYYKYNHLRDIVFALGAYCIYQRNFNLIYQLWEYNQPEDSTAEHLNPAIVPTKYGQILNFYFGASLEERTSAIYWDENHGKERYYHLYFILALVRAFSTPTGKKVDITEVQLPWTSFNSIKIKYDIDHILKNLQFLKRYEQYFVDLNLSSDIVNYTIINKVKPLLRHLKKQIP